MRAGLFRRRDPASETARAPVIDRQVLLLPISDGMPAGEPMQLTAEFLQIDEARRGDDPNLPAGIWQRELKAADWDQVIGLCADVLTKRSKDLQVAGWMIEALAHRHGGDGLAAGFDLVTGLCERFWDDLHPQLDEDGPVSRIAAIGWLNEKIPAIIRQLPITTSNNAGTSFSWANYVNARRLEALRMRDVRQAEKAEARGAVRLMSIESAIEATPEDFYRDVRDSLDAARAAVVRCEAVFDDRCGASALSLGEIRKVVDEIGGFAGAVLSQRRVTTVSDPAPEADPATPDDKRPDDGPEADPAAAPNERRAASHAIRSREEAYRLLSEVADYLHRTEPHSPTPYLLERAVQWGRMPLHQLVLEMSRGRKDFSALWDLLGLNDDQA